jgi:hypothetical protein
MSMDTIMKVVDSWKPARCCGINRRVHGFPRIPLRYISGRSDKNEFIARVEACLNTFSVTVRVVGGDEKGSLDPERVKYGQESHGTRTQK